MFKTNGNKEKMKELEDKITKIEAFLPAVELWLTILANWFKQNQAYINTMNQQFQQGTKEAAKPEEPKKEGEKSVRGA